MSRVSNRIFSGTEMAFSHVQPMKKAPSLLCPGYVLPTLVLLPTAKAPHAMLAHLYQSRWLPRILGKSSCSFRSCWIKEGVWLGP